MKNSNPNFTKPFFGHIDHIVLAIDTNKPHSPKTKIRFKFPNDLETKDDYCSICDKHFKNTLVGLPSGKTRWLGCDRCRLEENSKQMRMTIVQHLKDLHLLMNENKKWVPDPRYHAETPKKSGAKIDTDYSKRRGY